MSKNPIAELLGPHRKRRLKSNTLNWLSKIYSVFPPQLHTLVHKLDDVGDGSEPRATDEAGGDMSGLASGEVLDLSSNCEVMNLENGEVLSEGVRFNDSEMLVNESSRANRTKSVDGMASDDKEIIDGNATVCSVQEDSISLERIFVEESDDVGRLQQPVEGVKFDLVPDFNSSVDLDVLDENFMPIESNGNEELVIEENVNGDEVVEKSNTEVGVKSSTFGGDVASHAQVSFEPGFFDILDDMDPFDDIHLENVERNERKLCNEEILRDLSQMEGLMSSSRKEQEGVSVSTGAIVDTVKKGLKSGIVDNGKTKKRKRSERKEGKSAKGDSLVVDASNNSKSGGSNAVLLHGKVLKKNVFGKKEKSSLEKVDKCRLKRQASILYTREQLLQLRQMAVAPDNILKAVQAIAGDLLDKSRNPALGDSIGSDVLKKRKRGTSSEARKEKKKQNRRKKRAELNKKLGVTRLKLKPPVLKPKEVSHCRHYLKGRCQEGEKCKFSHDVVPLTKSKPCGHFARQECMKGDECPFDHLLSKYPCNNFATSGFCVRGDTCLFSHKVQDKEGLENTVGVSKEVKCPNQLDQLKPKQQQKANVISSSGVETTKNLMEASVTKTSQPSQAPKGLGFLSFGKSRLDDSVKHKQPDSLATPKGISLPSLNKPPHDISSDNLKTIQPSPCGVSATPAQSSNIVGGSAKNTPYKAQKGLSSALEFASKYTSGIKIGSGSATNKVDHKNEGTSTKNEASKASAVLELLFSGENKQKK